MTSKNYDFIIVGAGIVGLTLARALSSRRYGSVLLLEKESSLGRHASGRNSGVLHTGIYYAADSLKARVCAEGARLLRAYAEAHSIPINKTGKVIVASSPEAVPMLDVLYRQATANGARVEMITPKQLKEIEPEAQTCEQALLSPETAVIDAHQVLETLAEEINSLGVRLEKTSPVRAIDSERKIVKTEKGEWQYGHLINAAGLHADRIAHWMGVGKQYRILPFKGIYKKLRPDIAQRFRGAIYPVPNLKMPFLGVHFTKTIHGEVIVGPTALPALGRENYGIMDGLELKELPVILRDLLIMTGRNQDGFRNLVKEESGKCLPPIFLRSAQRLVPSITSRDFLTGEAKVGIRAQLVNQETMKLVMDFVVEKGPHSTHILNAISPAFTGSMSFANLIVDKL